MVILKLDETSRILQDLQILKQIRDKIETRVLLSGEKHFSKWLIAE